MPRTINPNLFPRSGYKFKDPATGVTFVGNSWAGVSARLAAYRRRNGVNPGDTLAEVMAQACADNPGYCVEDSEVTKAQIKIVSLKGRIIKWFNDLKKRRSKEGQLAFVDHHTALVRAGICINCPFNKELQEGCASCRSALRSLRNDIIEGRSAHESLIQHGCEILGTDLATAVHLDEITVENSQLPAHCWRKRTI